MREIKFRQVLWDYDNDIFLGFHWWGFIDGEFVEPIEATQIDQNNDNQQFTGLKDKNGLEIYEGDLVKGELDGETDTCPVVWSNRQAGFIPFCDDHYPLFDEHTELEVVGNIYENKGK